MQASRTRRQPSRLAPLVRAQVDADELAALFKSKFAELAFAKNQSVAMNFNNQLVKSALGRAVQGSARGGPTGSGLQTSTEVCDADFRP